MIVPKDSRGRDGFLDDSGWGDVVSFTVTRARAGAGGRGLFHADFRSGGGGGGRRLFQRVRSRVLLDQPMPKAKQAPRGGECEGKMR